MEIVKTLKSVFINDINIKFRSCLITNIMLTICSQSFFGRVLAYLSTLIQRCRSNPESKTHERTTRGFGIGIVRPFVRTLPAHYAQKNFPLKSAPKISPSEYTPKISPLKVERKFFPVEGSDKVRVVERWPKELYYKFFCVMDTRKISLTESWSKNLEDHHA